MKNNIFITIIIGFGFIGLGLFSLIFMFGAGFAFCGDIDLSEEVRKNCIAKTQLLSFFCFFSLIGSIFGFFWSGAIATKLSNRFGDGFVTKLDI